MNLDRRRADDQCRRASCRRNDDSAPPPRRDALARPAPTALACSDHFRRGILRTSRGVLLSGLREFHLNLRGKSVLLKPNLVEYIAGVEVNTNPVLVGAAAEAFLKLGAKSVVVGEGPGHQRDTYLVLAESGLADQLHSQKISFVDLNRDELGQGANEGHLHGSGASVAAQDCARS